MNRTDRLVRWTDVWFGLLLDHTDRTAKPIINKDLYLAIRSHLLYITPTRHLTISLRTPSNAKLAARLPAPATL